MEPIILVFIKLMGAAISGHWNLRYKGNTRDYDTLVRSPGWLSGSGPGWQSHKNVTFSPVGHAWLPKWLRPVTAMRANNHGENVHENYTDCVNLVRVRGQLRDCSNSVRIIVFFPVSSFNASRNSFQWDPVAWKVIVLPEVLIKSTSFH